MGKLYDTIDDKLAAWILEQSLFFVATAPSNGGHLNLSPKGPIESLRIVDERTIEYDDHVGSGAETVAHIRENGRICVMLCSFDTVPRVLRMYGRGEIISIVDPLADGVRSVIRVHVERIADACGFGVPLMEFVGPRPQRERWLAAKGDEIRDYVEQRNSVSIDGLPAFAGLNAPTN